MEEQSKPYFTSILVVTSHENNTCSLFASQTCLPCTHVIQGGQFDLLNAKDADTEKALLSCDVTTKVLCIEMKFVTVKR